jgi:hypothetical protein
MRGFLKEHSGEFDPDEVQFLVAAFDKAWETDQASGVRYPAAKAEQVRAMLETHYCGRNERRAQTGMCCSLRFSSRPAIAGAGLPGLILAGGWSSRVVATPAEKSPEHQARSVHGSQRSLRRLVMAITSCWSPQC